MVGTKEFYDLMEMFEKSIKHIYIPGTNSLNKEPKELWKQGRVYADGNVNSAFYAYMQLRENTVSIATDGDRPPAGGGAKHRQQAAAELLHGESPL